MPSGWTLWVSSSSSSPSRSCTRRLMPGTCAASTTCSCSSTAGSPHWAAAPAGSGRRGRRAGQRAGRVPGNARRVTAASTVPKLKEFLEQGGTILTIGPLEPGDAPQPARDERARREAGWMYPRGRSHATSSTSRGRSCVWRWTNTNPIAHGMPSELDVFFDEIRRSARRGRRPQGHQAGRLYKLAEDCAAAGPGARVTSTAPLPSSTRRSARASCTCSDRRSCSVRSRTAPTSSCSTGSTGGRWLRERSRTEAHSSAPGFGLWAFAVARCTREGQSPKSEPKDQSLLL